MDTRKPSNCNGANCPRAGHNIFGGMQTQHRRTPQQFPAGAAPQSKAKPKPAPTHHMQAYASVHLSAYVKDCIIAAAEGGAVVPLCMHRAEGKFVMKDGVARVPEDGYYMILWEAGTAACEGAAALHLRINEADVPVIHQLTPGYESGQQITWLNAGDQLSLVVDASEHAELTCSGAQLTIIRLG